MNTYQFTWDGNWNNLSTIYKTLSTPKIPKIWNQGTNKEKWEVEANDEEMLILWTYGINNIHKVVLHN
jgi:hypothetical protein